MLMTGAMYGSDGNNAPTDAGSQDPKVENGQQSPRGSRRWTEDYTEEKRAEMGRQLAAARAAQLAQLSKPSSSDEQAHDEPVAIQSPRRLRQVVQGPLVGTTMAPIPEQP